MVSIDSTKSLGTAIRDGIPLALLARIVNRLKKQHGGDKILRVTPASVAVIRTGKDRLGFSTDFPYLTEMEKQLQETAVQNERQNLPGSDT